MKDRLVVVALVLTFATLITTHVAVAFGLRRHPPRWRALLALVVPPLAPFWALKAGMRKSFAVWTLSFVSYGLALLVATR